MIRDYLQKRGYILPESGWYGHIDDFLQWYEGDVKSFHHYNIYNGTTTVKVNRYGLGMAKVVCEDHAKLLLNERTKISIDGPFGDRLQQILSDNDFWVLGNRLIEISFALGTGAFVEYIGSNGQPVIDYIRAEMIFPLNWDGNKITECAFGSLKQIGGNKIYYIQIHRLESGRYVLENVYLDKKSGQEIPPPETVQPIINTESALPLYQIVRPNIVNNIDLDCPMGISVYGNSISTLKAVDLIYDSYINEFVLGRKRIIVPLSMSRIMLSDDGTFKPAFDSNDVVFYAYQQSEDGKNDLKEINMGIRAQEHETGIQRQLNLLAKKCGLGNDRYQFDSTGGVKTATEVVSEKSELYQNLQKNQLVLESAFVDMCSALAYLSGLSQPPEVVIAFDDSIIQDAQSVMQDNIALVGAGLKSKLKAIMAVQGCTEEEAQAELERIASESRSGTPDDWFGGDNMPQNTSSAWATNATVIDNAEDTAGKALNGAQTQSLIGVLEQYSAGNLTLGQAVNVLSTAIGITKDEAKRIIEGTE